ncbi:MAG TPA: cyclic nucleotide-binding domain-containing protein [Candidatus Limnocylindrales bacterium]|nr:cyclic nucleotide-binding domain-containing protein [Candidatus Limnocylindrales bacterium]
MARDEKLELLKHVSLFRTMSDADLARLGELADEVDVPAGRTLTREGQSGQEFFVIVSGSARVMHGDHEIARLGTGDFLGEIALLDGKPRSATVVTEAPTRLLVLGHREFHSLMDEFPSVQRCVINALVERVRAHESHT